jgi:hypothetical protein
MKHALLLCTALAVGSTAHAQSRPAQAPRSSNSFTFTTSGSARAAVAWLEKEVNLSFRGEKPAEAVKIVLKAAGQTLDRVEIDEGLPTPEISLSVKGVQVRDALAAIGRLAAATTFISEKDDKVTVHLRKRSESHQFQVFTGMAESIPAEARARVSEAIQAARAQTRAIHPMITGFMLNSYLPNKRVSLDVRNTDVRDALKTILKQADVDYVLESDIPDNKKHSFTFENVPLKTALDVLCESIGVGWRAQRGEGDKKVLVRIGKKWVDRRIGQLLPEFFGSGEPGGFPVEGRGFDLPDIYFPPVVPEAIGIR